MKTALVFGATGLVGGYLVEELTFNSTYTKVKIFGRRTLGINNPKVEEHIINFEKLEEASELIKGDEIFICLGTTIKKAGTYKEMEKIDWHYPVSIAKIAQLNGVGAIAVVSSIGAKKDSGNKYLQIKGKMEEEILGLNFSNIVVARPSILLGSRNEYRFGESVGKVVIKAFGFLMLGKLKRYKGIHGRKVARALINILSKNLKDKIFQSDYLEELGS